MRAQFFETVVPIIFLKKYIVRCVCDCKKILKIVKMIQFYPLSQSEIFELALLTLCLPTMATMAMLRSILEKQTFRIPKNPITAKVWRAPSLGIIVILHELLEELKKTKKQCCSKPLVVSFVFCYLFYKLKTRSNAKMKLSVRSLEAT